MSLTAAAAPVVVKSAAGGLIASGVWTVVGMITVAIIGAIVAYIKIMPRLRELENSNNAGLRKEFIEEMGALRGEVSGLRTENGHLRNEVRDLREEGDLLRKEIRELHGVIDGLRRQNQTAQISGQRVVADALKSLPGEAKI